jgi:hypothetical protein
MPLSIPLLREVFVLAVASSLAGCCVSYGRVADLDRSNTRIPSDASTLLAAVERAVQPLGFDGRLGYWGDSRNGGHPAYFVRHGRDALHALIDDQPLAIGLSWQWNTRSDFVGQVQDAIGREFATTYGTTLEFKDRACGWFGP